MWPTGPFEAPGSIDMIAHCGTANLLAKPFSICFKPQMRQGKVRVTKLHLKSNFMLVSLVMKATFKVKLHASVAGNESADA